MQHWLVALVVGITLASAPATAGADVPPAGLTVEPASAAPGATVSVTGTQHMPACQTPAGSIIVTLRDGPDLATVSTYRDLTSFQVDATLPADLHEGRHVIESRCVLLPEPGVEIPLPLASTPIDIVAPTESGPPDPPPTTDPDPPTTVETGGEPGPGAPGADGPTPVGGDRDAPAAGTRPTGPAPTTPTSPTTSPSDGVGTTDQPPDDEPRLTPPADAPAPQATPSLPTEPGTTGDTSDTPRRSFTNLARFENLGLDAARTGAGGAMVAAFALLVGFPATLFDVTLRRNYDRLTRRLHGTVPTFASVRERIARTPRLLPLGAFVVAAATAGLFLEDGVGWNRHTAITFVALTTGLAVTAYVRWLPAAVVADRKRVPGRFRSYPMALYLVVGGVLLTVTLEINPGYLYGLLFAYDLNGPWTADDDGLTFGWGFALILALSIGGWLAWMPVHDAVTGGSTFALAEIADTALAVIIIAGIEGAVLGLLPFPFTPGAAVRRWSPKIWAALYAVGFLAFTQILLRPDLGYVEFRDVRELLPSIIAFLAFAGGSVWFWWYLNYRRPAPVTAPVPATAGNDTRVATAPGRGPG